MEPFHQSRLITAKISYFSNEIQLSLNHVLIELFEIIGVNKQMFISFGQDEPHRSPKEAYFNGVIGIYFLSFFYEHPVLKPWAYQLQRDLPLVILALENPNIY